MPTSSYQVSGMVEETSHRDLSRNELQRCSKGPSPVAMTLYHEPHTDVMFVDLCQAPQGQKIDVIDVGEMVGLPGQVFARVNLNDQVLYGLTVQNFSAFKSRLLWSHRVASVRSAFLLIIAGIRAGFSLDQRHSLPAGMGARV